MVQTPPLSEDYRLRPKLGRPGNRGGGRARSYLKRARSFAARLNAAGKPTSPATGFTGRFTGRGNAGAAMARHWSRARSRRVIVKVHIARRTSLGTAGFAKHISYIQREGVDRDGGKGETYDRTSDMADGSAFNQRAAEDRRQFRLIVSPEDARDLADQKGFVRDFMKQVESDLGTRLDWVAVDHHDTGQPHTHIVIRGGNQRDGELIIAKSYITHGFRDRAEALVTDELGLRRFRDIAASRMQQVERDAFTAIDRKIEKQAKDGLVRTRSERSAIERYDQTVLRRRLHHLKRLGLASSVNSDTWRLKTDWTQKLRALGKRGDLVRTIAAEMGDGFNAETVATFSPSTAIGGAVTGRLAAILPGDELRNGKLILLDGMDGRQWTHAIGETETALLPDVGGVVTLSASPARAKPADRTIAGLASRHGGTYSDEIHAREDPSASPAFRLAHKRRLEALRRMGVVKRSENGDWAIPDDFEARILKAEAKRAGVQIRVESWRPTKDLTEAMSETWLDRLNPGVQKRSITGFGADVRAAVSARTDWLASERMALTSKDELRRLNQSAFWSALGNEASRTGKQAVDFNEATDFRGRYSRNVDLAQGRFAVLESDTQIALVKWQTRIANWKGRDVSVARSGRQLQWTLARTRSLSR